MLTALIDYDSGNLHSAQKAFQRMAAEAGAGEVIVTARPGMWRAPTASSCPAMARSRLAARRSRA